MTDACESGLQKHSTRKFKIELCTFGMVSSRIIQNSLEYIDQNCCSLPLPAVDLLPSLFKDLAHASTVTTGHVLDAFSLPTLFQCATTSFRLGCKFCNAVCTLRKTPPVFTSEGALWTTTALLLGLLLFAELRQSHEVGFFVCLPFIILLFLLL